MKRPATNYTRFTFALLLMTAFLILSTSSAAAKTTGSGDGDIVFAFGNPGDVPVAGDWDAKP